MDFKHFTAGKDDNGRRLDKIARRLLNENALSSLYKTIRKGLIKVNGKKQTAEFRISEGDIIDVAEFLINSSSEEKKEKEYKKIPEEMVIFRNDSILFLNKPYDINVQPSKDSKISLSEIVEEDFKARKTSESLSFRTGPLHRLDRKTTGLIAFSQDLEGAKWFSTKMQTHDIEKIYLGIVEGQLTEKKIWESFVERNEDENENFHKVTILDSDNENAKYSYTEAEPISFGKYEKKSVTLVKFTIKTGRTHQIRAVSSKNGFPLLGDTAYGSEKTNLSREFYLHAFRLIFKFKNKDENKLNLPQKIEAKIPEDFKKVIKICNLLFDDSDS